MIFIFKKHSHIIIKNHAQYAQCAHLTLTSCNQMSDISPHL